MENVRSSPLAGNVDSPEAGKSLQVLSRSISCPVTNDVSSHACAGLDALMQVISCEQDIGWRPDVRRIVFMITDEEPHYAYDGQLAGKKRQVAISLHLNFLLAFAGLPMPNDGQCHLKTHLQGSMATRTKRYSAALEMDYPSFGQIRERSPSSVFY